MLNVKNVMQETRRNVTKKIPNIELFSKEQVEKHMQNDMPQKKGAIRVYWLLKSVEQQVLYQ